MAGLAVTLATPINKLFDTDRIGFASYFLAIGYLALSVSATLKFRDVSKYLVQWNSQKLFHLFIGVHLYVRTVSFGLLCFFSLTQSNAWYPLSVMLYTLPEFLILTVYQLLFFQWLEIFVFSHEQFIIASKERFRRLWKGAFFLVTLVVYLLLGGYYALLAFRSDSFYASALHVIEFSAAAACVALPCLFLLLFLYISRFLLAGFPFHSQLAAERVRKINRVVFVWSAARDLRGTLLFLTLKLNWENTLPAVSLAMIVVAVLVATEWIPIYMTLDWTVVGTLLLGEETAPINHIGQGGGAGGQRAARQDSLVSVASDDAERRPLNPAARPNSPRFGRGSPSSLSPIRAASLSASALSLFRNATSPQIDDRFLVRPNELQLAGEIVQDTGFAFTQRGVYRNHAVIVKGFRFQDQEAADPALLDELSSEIVRRSSLKHPNIVHFIGVCRGESLLYVVTEYLPGHSLYHILERSSKPFFPETLLSIAVQIARALQFIHSQGPDWVHGSLGSATVLLDALMNVKVADIGFSRLKAYAEIMLVKRMFSEWSAPEVFKGANPSQASDCWAFGVIVWELITRKHPYEGMDMEAVREVVVKRKQVLQIPDRADVPVPLQRLVLQCWAYAPADRPNAAQITAALEQMIEGA